MNFKHIILNFKRAILCALAIATQEITSEYTCYASEVVPDNNVASMAVVFRVNSSDIDSCFKDNAQSLADIRDFLHRAQTDSTILITDLSIVGYASPDGPRELNDRLARGRMNALKKYVYDFGAGVLSRSTLIEKSEIESMAALRSALGHRAVSKGNIFSDLIKSSDASLQVDQLKSADGGRLWEQIKPLLFKLRYARVQFDFTRKQFQATDTAVSENVVQSETDGMDVVPECEIPPADMVAPASTYIAPKPWYASLKTNILYDAMLISTIGMEVYVGGMWSVNANWSYAWWKTDRRHRYWRYYGGDFSVRRWFGAKAAAKPLTGHHLGLYGQALIYDFEFGGKGQMAGKPGASLWESCNWGVGVDYGFSLPIARRLNIDFTIGVGYVGGKYYDYKPIDGHYVWQATKKRRWFGPTKAEISLVWLIGRGNSNKQKGGAR